MKIDVLTLFPEMVQGPMTQSIIGKAIEAGKIEFETTDFRQFSNNKHNHVDDYPFGGGAGMLLKVEPIDLALASIRERFPETTPRVILMDPAGKTFTQRMPKSCRRKNIWYLFVVTMKVMTNAFVRL